MIRKCPNCSTLYAETGVAFDGTSGTVTWDGGSVHLTRRMGLVFELLLGRCPRTVTKAEVGHALYGHDPDGGPLDLDRNIMMAVYHTRERLKEGGFPGEVRTIWARGWELILAPPSAPQVEQRRVETVI